MLDTQQVEQTNSSTKPTKTKIKTKTAKPAKTARKERERPAAASLRNTARRMVVKNPQITTEELFEAVVRAGFNPSKFVVAQHRNSVRDILRIMQQEGIQKIQL